MGLSLKKDDMIKFLDDVKTPEETYSIMLWGTVSALINDFKGRSLASLIMAFTPAPGVGASLTNAFCYMGLTEETFYAVAVDSYNTSNVIGTFRFPLKEITSFNLRKGILGNSYSFGIICGGPASFTVKSTSIGTDIKDQKERMADFIEAIKPLVKQ